MSKNILEQLLGSSIRFKVLRFLFRNEHSVFTASQLAEHIQETRGIVKQELDALVELGLIKVRRT